LKQLVILSGKGGTGKTTIANALIHLFQAKSFADCDVDAPNLHLLNQTNTQAMLIDYYGLPKAVINNERCIKCDECRQYCRFDAIKAQPEYSIDPFACEGCGFCERICPTQAIELRPEIAGELRLYQDDTIFSTAQLKMGSGTSGLLVTEVKKQMIVSSKDTPIAIIDGSPGIGCPVIASISGVDMVLIVTEPSVSGMSDMKRIIRTAEAFHVDITICINKYNTNLHITNQIEDYCREHDLLLVGKIPFDPAVVKAINNGQSIANISCVAGDAIRDIGARVKKILED